MAQVDTRPPHVQTPAPEPEAEHPLLRSLLLYLSRAPWARGIISRVWLARRMASRFVAGDTADDALAAIAALNRLGIAATLDHLGESVTNEAEAARAAQAYVDVLGHLNRAGARSNVSIKLTQMGLDVSEEVCERNVRNILEAADIAGNFVRIDMEGTPHTDATLRLFHALHRDFDNVGIVLQAYLYRTEADLRRLLEVGARIRLCKGAYMEPPDKAYPRKADVDANFVRLAEQMLEASCRYSPASANGRVPPLAALATHDEKMITAVRQYAEAHNIPRDRFEFQMLYGIRRDLQERLAAEGYAVRVYVPYGTEWYPYFMRRLAERPANLWFFLSNLFR